MYAMAEENFLRGYQLGLNDAINGLLQMRHELRAKMYPEKKETPYILEYKDL